MSLVSLAPLASLQRPFDTSRLPPYLTNQQLQADTVDIANMLTDAIYALKQDPAKAQALKEKIKAAAADPAKRAKLEEAAAKLKDLAATPEGQEIIAIVKENMAADKAGE